MYSSYLYSVHLLLYLLCSFFDVSSYVRIGGAAVLGIGIILGALYVQQHQNGVSADEGVVVSVAPERQYIPTTDSDGDGVDDWKEGLAASAFEAVATPTSSLAAQDEEPYIPPTTFTGKFAEAFFTDYMEGKARGIDLEQNKGQLIQNAAAAIEANTKSKTFAPKDLIIVPDSLENLREYGNRVGEIVNQDTAVTELNSVLAILQQSLNAQDPQLLEGIVAIRIAYEQNLAAVLTVPVPSSLIASHIALLNTGEAVRSNITAIEQVFNDPLLALARVSRYEGDVSDLSLSLKKIASALIAKNIVYASDEPGSFFYSFNI